MLSFFWASIGQGEPLSEQACKEHWPPGLLDLVEQYGGDAVYAAGMEVLGFPATWANCGEEFKKIREQLASKGR